MNARLLLQHVIIALSLFISAACSPEAETASATNGAEPEIIVSEDWTEEQKNGWLFLIEELEVQELHAALTREHRPSDYVIENVNVITMMSEVPLMAQSVFVSDGHIASIAPTAAATRPADATAYDGAGMWLVPGLADMHVHNLTSYSQHLLNLAMGITTVRDLDGFPFLLAMREKIAEGGLLAPRMFVSGTILNGNDFGGYALQINSVEEARQAVREQKSAGYDFIKTHNSLSVELFDAIADEARAQNIDLVGHIPVPVSVAHAVQSGMRTFEHFKGYILDSTLSLSDEDYVAATRGAEIWNTPTFTTYRNHLRGEEAKAILSNEEEMQYVSPRVKKQWASFGAQEVDKLTELRQNIYPLSRQIFSELRTLDDAKFLAGTDSGSYELMTPGFVLLEELRIFQELGITPFEALQTATVNAAEAMRVSGEFGVIEEGASADFVLLRENPLEDAARLSEIEAVGLRGVWIDSADRSDMLARLKNVYARSGERMNDPAVTQADLDDFLARIKELHEEEFIFLDHYLDYAASMYAHVGRDDDAATINAMKIDPDYGFSWFKF